VPLEIQNYEKSKQIESIRNSPDSINKKTPYINSRMITVERISKKHKRDKSANI